MAEIYLVRHGQASFGAADYDQLSALGAEQCSLLGAWFADCGLNIDQIVTGGMKRHLQSADAFLSALPPSQQPTIAPSIDEGFNEFNHREMLRRFDPELTDLDAVKRRLADSDDEQAGFAQIFAQSFGRWIGGQYDAEYSEPWPQFSQRCNAAVARIAENSTAQSTVVFTSVGAISAIVQKLLAIPDDTIHKLNLMMHNGGVTKLSAESGDVKPVYINSCGHFERSGVGEMVTQI